MCVYICGNSKCQTVLGYRSVFLRLDSTLSVLKSDYYSAFRSSGAGSLGELFLCISVFFSAKWIVAGNKSVGADEEQRIVLSRSALVDTATFS